MSGMQFLLSRKRKRPEEEVDVDFTGRSRTRLRLRFAALCLIITFSGVSCDKSVPNGGADALPSIKTKSGVEMVVIPAGTFQMGSRGGKEEASPVHTVSIDAFLMDKYEVTQAEYEKHSLPNGSHFKGPNMPVEQISWTQAALFCNIRSRAEGLKPCYNEDNGACDFEADGYRLPTEAEWEYACRAGTDSDYNFGSDARGLGEYAWFADNAGKKTHPVGQKKPNAWGLHDMYGNVAEWCNDNYDARYYASSPDKNPRGPADGDKNVLRGGAWNTKPDAINSAHRVGENPGFADACFARDAIGFRCVRKAP